MYGRALGLLTHDSFGPYLTAGMNIPLAAAMVLLLWTGTTGDTMFQVSAFAVAAGGFGLFLGYRDFRIRQTARNTPTSSVRSMAVGPVELEGEARPPGGPCVSPLGGEEAALVEIEVQAERSDGSEGYWETVGRYRYPSAFVLDDGTGEVRVDPEGADLRCEPTTTVERDDGESPPEKLEDLADRVQVEEAPGLHQWAPGPLEDLAAKVVGTGDPREHLVASGQEDRRYVERVVAPDGTTYVLGHARRREDAGSARNEENLVVADPPRRGVFVVADGTEDEIRSRTRLQVMAYLLTGLVAFPLGAVGLLRLSGVV